jgi:hypothetical protein
MPSHWAPYWSSIVVFNLRLSVLNVLAVHISDYGVEFGTEPSVGPPLGELVHRLSRERPVIGMRGRLQPRNGALGSGTRAAEIGMRRIRGKRGSLEATPTSG